MILILETHQIFLILDQLQALRKMGPLLPRRDLPHLQKGHPHLQKDHPLPQRDLLLLLLLRLEDLLQIQTVPHLQVVQMYQHQRFLLKTRKFLIDWCLETFQDCFPIHHLEHRVPKLSLIHI